MYSGRKYLKDAYQAIYENDFQRAISAFLKAIDCEPDNPLYHYKLSITYSRDGNMKEAIKSAKKACDLSENQTYRYHLQILLAKNNIRIAKSKIDTGSLSSDTEKLLIQAKKLDPLNIEGYIVLGIFYGEKKLYNQSHKEFELALKLDPLNKYAKYLKEHYNQLNQEGERDEEN